MDLFEYSKNTAAVEKETADQQEKILTVTEVTAEIKQLLVTHFQAKALFWIKGEISGYKGRNQSGHIYFKLKDENAILNCVFFKFSNTKSKVEMKEGLSVFVRGRIDVYEKNGNYQMIVDEIRADGAGDLYLKFEELKRKLQDEGLFLPEHKKALPKFPSVVGIVTSSTGAVVRDIIHVIRNRFPLIKILLFPVRVQGDGAADDIVRALAQTQSCGQSIDVVIVGRGGGSIEDLWPFNEEKVARAIFACKIPIISAVGHQTDFTIADFVADVRAATPSQAAEMIVPVLSELQSAIQDLMKQIAREVVFKKDFYREKLIRFQRSPVLVNPRNLVYQKAQRYDFAFERFQNLILQLKEGFRKRLDQSKEKFNFHIQRGFSEERARLDKATSNLALVNPLSVLSRGFSIVEKKNKQIVRASGQVSVKEEVTIRLHEGILECQVLKN